MTPALNAALRLERLAAALADTESADARWLAERLKHYLDAAPGVSLDEALGLACRPGGVPWRRQRALAHRDVLIRRLAEHFCAESLSECAASIATTMRNYAATGWLRERRNGLSEGADPHRRLLFQIYTLDPNPPTGIRRLIEIIGKTSCSETSLSTARDASDNLGADQEEHVADVLS